MTVKPFNVQVYHHNDVGWVYSAGAFVAGNTPILDQNVIHGTENNIVGGEHFAFKHTGDTDAIAGASSEGLVMKVTTSVSNSISYMD